MGHPTCGASFRQPAAGSGTRIQPLAFSKELLPVGSRFDGSTERPRAVSDYLVDRMVTGGAGKIAFVISPTIREHVAGDLLLFQSMLRGTQEVEPVEPGYPFSASEHFERPAYPRMAFIENKYCGDETNWWIQNRACAEAMLRSAGFEVIDHPEEEVFVCRVGARSPWAVPVYPRGAGE